ncbi:hypothetical protein OPU71_09740 [Niveibacterium sp. 24ML]|uniref:hypothetical protein n=1 Tax=Niveibacterium sp. 24ML TaxID=2985512 RepID=UPI00226E1BD5|nr:hypothetical protein [Niveibacterium sp. 24ML]MCX9156403.1 hypothetical protein [Niveibacterium sp. 24ML]
MKRIASVLIAAAFAQSAFAADRVVLMTPVTYTPDSSIVQKVKDECQPEQQVARQVESALNKKFGGGSPITSLADANGAQVMKIQVSHVLGVGGGAWSGPKAITVYVDLLENGKVVRKTRVNRWSTGGMWGGFKGTCSILDRCAAALAKDLTRWAADPNVKLEDDAVPKDAAPEDKAAAQSPAN